MPSFLDRWEEVDRLLEEALDLPPAERDRFLDRACPDAELRRHVDRLLQAAVADQSVFNAGAEALAVDLFDEGDAEPDAPLVGQQVGPYRLVRELGAGGMGVVFLAERADGAFAQQVALKLVRRDVATSEVLRRFRHERQLLASLQHPNIARLYDGGLSADGLPYLVMEYVEGVPITDYCDRHRLSTRARLRLFCTVCRAVQHAHQNLIVHRDLKPSNILVAEDGTVKLLDFGIAKVLDPASAEPTTPLTRTGMHLMTPEYASPEQVRGEPITTASDVYALGVLFYELLTGVRPYRLASRLQHEVARVILEQEPTRPSTVLARTRPDPATAGAIGQARATSVERLQRQLRGDLDNIALKALAKEPARRYGTVGQFMDDLERHLGGVPVQARPATLGYRAAKFVRRHRAGVAATAGMLALVALLVGFYTARLAQERDRAAQAAAQATREAAKATAIKDFVLGLFGAADPDRRATVTARDLLDEGTARIDAELTGQPEVQTEMMVVMAGLYQTLGDYGRADTLAAAALAVRRAAFGEEHPLVADALSEQGAIRRHQGRYAEADSLHRLALALRRKLQPDADSVLAESLNELGLVAWRRGDYETAEQMYRESLARRRRALGDSSISVSASLNNLGLVLVDQARYAEAVPLLEESLAIRRARLGGGHSRVAVALNNLAYAYSQMGEDARAEPLYREVLDMRRAIFGEEHPDVASSLINLGASLQNLGRLAEAESLMRDSWEMRKKLLGEHHPLTLVSQERVADVLKEQGRAAEAEALLRDMLVHARARLGAEHPDVAHALARLGEALEAQGRLAEADTAYQQALAMHRRLVGDTHRRTASSLLALARLRAKQGRADEAEAFFREGIDAYRRVMPGHPNLAAALNAFAAFLDEQGRRGDAEAARREAGAIRAAAPARPDR